MANTRIRDLAYFKVLPLFTQYNDIPFSICCLKAATRYVYDLRTVYYKGSWWYAGQCCDCRTLNPMLLIGGRQGFFITTFTIKRC